MELKPCPQCGGTDLYFDSTGTSECYGWAWQTLSIQCENHKEHCGAGISMNFDFHGIDNSEEVLATAWNALTRKP